MKDKSYIEKRKESFPNLEMPFSEERMTRIKEAALLKPQSRYVTKSERLTELEKELALATALSNKVNEEATAWEKGRKVPDFRYQKLPYLKYEKEVGSMIGSLVRPIETESKKFADQMTKAISSIQNYVEETKTLLSRDIQIENKGIEGENKVEAYIAKTLDCKVLSSVVLPGVMESENAPKTAETDLMVFSKFGVFVCEIKNYGKAGQTMEVQPDGRLFKKDYYGRVLEDMGSPFEQNARHCKAVVKVLAEAGLAGIPVYPVVIIANTDVNVVNQSSFLVKDMYGFCDAVTAGYDGAVSSDEDTQAAYQAIKKNRMPERKFPMPSISLVRDVLDLELADISALQKANEQWVRKFEVNFSFWVRMTNDIWMTHNESFVKYANFRQRFGYANVALGVISTICCVVCLLRCWLWDTLKHSDMDGFVLILFMIMTCVMFPMGMSAVDQNHVTEFHGGRVKLCLRILLDCVARLIFSAIPALMVILHLMQII